MITMQDAQTCKRFYHRSFRGVSPGEAPRSLEARPFGELEVYGHSFFFLPVYYVGWGMTSHITNIPARFSKPAFNPDKGELYECASHWYTFNPFHLCKQEVWCMYQDLDQDYHENFYEWPLDVLKDWLMDRNHPHLATVNKYLEAERDGLDIAPITVQPYLLGPGALDGFVFIEREPK